MARHAKNRAEAVQFLEYLASDEAQSYFANGNNEWPAVPGVKITGNPALEAMGDFKIDNVAGRRGRREPGAGAADARPRRLQIAARPARGPECAFRSC